MPFLMNKTFLLYSSIVQNFLFNILSRHTASDNLNLRILASTETHFAYSAEEAPAMIMNSSADT